MADYARGLAAELARRGHDIVTGPADAAILSTAPYALGVYTGWLRVVVQAARLRRRTRRIVVVRHEVFERPDNRLRMRVFEALQRWSARRLEQWAAATVVADGARADRLRRLVPAARPPEIVAVGPNLPVPRNRAVRVDSDVVLVVGLLHAERDFETLVEAFPQLLERRPATRLVLAGALSGNDRRLAAIERRARELGVPTTQTGRLPAEELARCFAEAGTFFSGYTRSLSFGSGTLAAALAYALPVVVYDSARLGPGLAAGETVLTAPRTAEGVAAALELALGEDGRRVGSAGRRLYESELSWEVIAARFDELLRRVTVQA
jgi:glycosyltransferase involved in cell wall biosynthesis